MTEGIKFTDIELKELQTIQQKLSDVLVKLGQFELQRINLQNSKKKVEEEYSLLLLEQNELAKKLNDKYGPGVVDPKTGVFVPETNNQ